MSTAARNARLDAVETAIGVSAVLEIRTGAQPANCAAGASGTILVSMTLPSDYFSNASGGTKSKLGTWSGTGLAAGTAAHYRLWDSSGNAGVCHMQGSVTQTGGGGDMTLDNTSIAVSQVVTITSDVLTDGNA